jgi:hypothetical protein
MCAVHRDNCCFWPGFARQWQQDQNLILQLAQYSGKKCFVVNNPRTPDALAVLNHDRIKLTHFSLQRDLRALAASYIRKNPGKDIGGALNDWLITATRTMLADFHRRDAQRIRYEHVSTRQKHLAEILTKHTGISYGNGQLRYWEKESHVVTGNAGTIGTIRSFHGLDEKRQLDVYSSFMEKINKGDDISFADERWRSELNEFDLYVIDRYVGYFNSRMGYERNLFDTAAKKRFKSMLEETVRKNAYPRLNRYKLEKPLLAAAEIWHAIQNQPA